MGKKSVCGQILNSLAEIATEEVKSTGVFTIPGVCKIKTRVKPATKAGKREVFGKVVMVKAKPEDCGEGVPSSRPEEAVLRPNPMLGFATSDLEIRPVGVPRKGSVRQPSCRACRGGLCDQVRQVCHQTAVFSDFTETCTWRE